ncbi:hypothetical protein Tsubulata_031387 [Turnera subulata]|uniref:Uncharacterized protein n=1 Tax=Turnera subulata TaxID=218843 RepID=A0A9Q0FMP1_9ROSI|nr:hypothetical protein Tsubulata_031387 [Turnera subulata]
MKIVGPITPGLPSLARIRPKIRPVRYGEQEITKLTRDNNISCPSGSEKKSRTTDFNYPSVTVKVEPRTAFQTTVINFDAA